MIHCAPIAIVSFLTFLVAAMLPSLARAQTQRNILMIILDDVGVDMIGAYEEGEFGSVDSGKMVPSTPTIDDLAQQGILLRNV